ncbi:MAG: TonB-dependent receptor [Sphingobacteriaceae bacterium]|nr:MAG: TonB-dependent receptor [Sphingobacteriaceae bacterium]
MGDLLKKVSYCNLCCAFTSYVKINMPAGTALTITNMLLSLLNFTHHTIYSFRIAGLTAGVILAALLPLAAQTPVATGKITGTAIIETGKPAEFATIGLLRAKDSSLVKGTLANARGEYVFDRIPQGDYILTATTIGYIKASSTVFTLNSNALTVPALTLQPENRTLNTVTVTAAKPLIERRVDRMVMNVENSVLAAGNNALEILERAPGVTVDRDDNISLQGKSGATVMINDKLTYLSSTQLSALLRSTDGTTIQSVEIITNPSAKYDAAGNSGIINIKLKKNKQSGTNGSVTVGAGQGLNFRDNASINLNHKEGDWNFFGSFSHGDRKRKRLMTIDRVVENDEGDTYFHQDITMLEQIHYNNYRFGADHNTSKRNTIGFLVKGDFSTGHDQNNNRTSYGPALGVVDTSKNTLSHIRNSFRNYSINLNDKFLIDTLGQEISIDVDYAKFNNNSNASYITRFFLANGAEFRIPQSIFNRTPSNITINTQKVDYVKPLNKTTKLEAGIKLSFVKTDNDLQAQIDSTGNGLVNDVNRTNRFVYDERISAAYVNFSKEFKNTSIQLGLRAEHTLSTGNLITIDSVSKRNYLDLFPTLFINQKLGAKHELGFSYSRRIDRPSYEDLNPFTYYLDEYTFSQGNPFLQPQYTNSFELNYTYNKTINVSLSYSHTSDVITEVILTDTKNKSTYQTSRNFDTQNDYNIGINSPYTVAKWWSGNADFNGFYVGFKTKNLQGGDVNQGKFAFVLKTTQTFLLPKQVKGEITTFYQSATSYGLYNIKPQYAVDAGISRSFIDKKLNVKLAVNDIFNIRRNDITTNYQSTNFSLKQKQETRIYRIALTYNFGNMKIKARERSTGADAESGRVKSRN